MLIDQIPQSEVDRLDRGREATLSGYQLTAVIQREGDLFIAHCVELDIPSRGYSGAVALANLKEAVSSFVASADDDEILRRLTREVEVTQFEIECAWFRSTPK